ncbi:hypothetical protein [Cohnella lupini]|uniref:Uncharacterized protein n=1 Tax=Cohnella lupini TaxID=1294267 RepID=A0A3D9IX18_9BACL|nr:hypothetical protein [Cohnella lupini]RED66255.1 hypothetical protein DFP95_101754 [Cohnella lupini]
MIQFFAFTSIFLMPILGFLFVIELLRAIKKIVKDKPYTTEAVWSGILFALIVWCITFVAVYREL